MSKFYEVWLQQHVKGSVEDDYETVDTISTYEGGRADTKLAKDISPNIGKDVLSEYGRKFPETDRLDKGLANVAVVCYNQIKDVTTYNILYIYDYQHGKKVAERVF